MTCEVRLREEADRDLAEAAFWYELHANGLGFQFLDEILRVLTAISEHQFIYPLVWRETRRALTNRFPFAIYFRMSGDMIVVVAVMHGSRHPRSWMRRR